MHTLSPSNHRGQWTKRVHEDPNLLKGVNAPTQLPSSLRAHASTEIPPEALQFAPPLAAYTAERSGADEIYLEYNSTSQSAALRGMKDIALFLPQTLKKLQLLQRIRETGYFTLRPVGFNKTMAELDREALVEEDEHRSAHAENLAAMTTSGEHLGQFVNGGETDELSRDLAGNNDIPSIVLTSGMDRDLDSNLVDADINDLSLRTEDGDSDTPDAFMAEEVEYQHDHSLASGSVQGSANSMLHDQGSAGSGPAWNSPLVTTSSRVLSTSSHRNSDESDIDMTLDE